LCARYERLLDDLRGAIDEFSFGHEPWIDNEDGAVFVDVVEFTQDPQRITLRGRGLSLVWLRAQDRCELVRREKLTQGFHAPRLVKSVLSDEEGKVNFAKDVPVCRQRFHHRVRDVIQARTQLVDGVSEGESALSRWCKELCWGGAPLPLKVVVNDGRFTRVYSGAPSKNNVLEVTEVFLSPLDLCFGRIE